MVDAQAKVEAAEEAPLASVTQGARIKVPHQLFLTLFPKTNNPCRRTDQTTLYLNEIGHYATIAQNRCADADVEIQQACSKFSKVIMKLLC